MMKVDLKTLYPFVAHRKGSTFGDSDYGTYVTLAVETGKKAAAAGRFVVTMRMNYGARVEHPHQQLDEDSGYVVQTRAHDLETGQVFFDRALTRVRGMIASHHGYIWTPSIEESAK